MIAFLKVPTILLIITIGFIFSMAMSVLQSTFALFSDRVLFPDADPEIVARNVGFILMFIGIFIRVAAPDLHMGLTWISTIYMLLISGSIATFSFALPMDLALALRWLCRFSTSI